MISFFAKGMNAVMISWAFTSAFPRKGETVTIHGKRWKVTDVIWLGPTDIDIEVKLKK